VLAEYEVVDIDGEEKLKNPMVATDYGNTPLIPLRLDLEMVQTRGQNRYSGCGNGLAMSDPTHAISGSVEERIHPDMFFEGISASSRSLDSLPGVLENTLNLRPRRVGADWGWTPERRTQQSERMTRKWSERRESASSATETGN